MTEEEIYKQAESGMTDKARYKMANLAAHGYDVTGTWKVAFLQRKEVLLMINLDGDVFKLNKCI